MTISSTTADQLDALATTLTAASAPDVAFDTQLAALIAEPMMIIDGRVLTTGFKYTLNVTCALLLRPKHWYLYGIDEYNTANVNVSSAWPATCGLVYVPDTPAGFASGTNAHGFTIGLATGACICRAWALLIRMWLGGNYPLAISQPA